MPGSNLVPVDQLKIKPNQYGSNGENLPAYQRDFIQRFAPYAMLASAQSGIPARFLLAEASIETNWGQSKSAREDNNLFGIKATPAQIAAGQKVTYRNTGENRSDGSAYTENSPFIVYDTPEAGFNGFVEKLNKTRWADQKALLQHTAENPYAQDNDVETALAGAFARTSYLTADKIDQTMLDRMARMPSDLNAAGFKTAPDFNKATTDLARVAPFKPDDARNVSAALGDFTDNDYVSPNGLPVLARPPELSALDRFSDSITQGVEGAGAAIGNTFSGFGDAIKGVFGTGASAAEAGRPAAPAPSSTDFSGANVSGNVGNGALNPALTPFAPAPGQFDFAHGTDVSGGAQPGTMNPGLVPGDTAFSGRFDPSAYLAANPDVAADAGARANPWQHYLQYGLNEGRAIDARGDRFDPSRYLAQNADVLQAGMDPLMHYARFGAAEGRAAPIVGADGSVQMAQNFSQGLTIGPQQANTLSPQQAGTIGPQQTNTIGPSGVFDAAAYLRNNPDLAAAHVDPVEHFLRFGADEGRIIDDNGDRFDAKTYGAQNADVLAAGMDPLLHYVKFGAAEGRQAPIIGPDGTVRMVSNLGLTSPVASDLAAQLLAAPSAQTQPPAQSGLTIGAGPTAPTIGAGPATQAFDGNAYLQANKDVAAAGYTPDTAIQHFLRFGQAEDRPLTLSGLHFDGQAYLAKNPDVARAGMSPIEHYLKFGQSEGRDATLIGPSGQAQEVHNWMPANVVGPDAWAQTIGAPAATPTIGAPGLTPLIGPPAATPTIGPQQGLTIGAGPAVQATSPGQIGAYNFSQANVGGALGASPQTFGSFYGPTSSLNNLGLDTGQPAGAVNPYGFGGDVSGFDVNGFGGGAPQASSQTAYGPPTQSVNFNPQASENAYLDSQVNQANQSNAALDAFNPALRTGMFTSSTGNPDIYKAASDYNVATIGINAANAAKIAAPAAAPVNVPRVAQGNAFTPAPFFGRW
jgi:hypothetical protein